MLIGLRIDLESTTLAGGTISNPNMQTRLEHTMESLKDPFLFHFRISLMCAVLPASQFWMQLEVSMSMTKGCCNSFSTTSWPFYLFLNILHALCLMLFLSADVWIKDSEKNTMVLERVIWVSCFHKENTITLALLLYTLLLCWMHPLSFDALIFYVKPDLIYSSLSSSEINYVKTEKKAVTW